MKAMALTAAVICACTACALGELKATDVKFGPQVTVTLARNNEKLSGQLYYYDAEKITIGDARNKRDIRWGDLNAPSRYNLRLSLIDKKSAADWMEMAELAHSLGMKAQAQQAVASAVRIDPKMKLKGDAILRAKPTTNASAIIKYEKSNPKLDAEAIAKAQKVAKECEEKLSMKLVELQTAHFIIFTDWDEKEYDFLKKHTELAYSAVSKEFDISDKENIFVGKLPVFMFATQDEFAKYAANVDGFPASRGVLGYFYPHDDGSGHMVMWKPDVKRHGSLKVAEDRWASTLTHEFTHAFVARYRTNRRIPRWLNEGLAEVIAQRSFPEPESYSFAKRMAEIDDFGFEYLFDDRMMPGGAMYPVMQTLVEALIKENRKSFRNMFDDIKDGMEPADAIRKHYKIGERELEAPWRRYVKALKTATPGE